MKNIEKFKWFFLIKVVFVFFLILFSPWNFWKEINTIDYKWLKSDCTLYPQILPVVEKFYVDKKITQHEFNKIQSMVRNLRKKENESSFDSIKIEFDKCLKELK